MTDDEIVGMLIGFLLAGQHTSSTTSAWLGFFWAKHKDMQVIHVNLVTPTFANYTFPPSSSLPPFHFPPSLPPSLQDQAYAEQVTVRGEELPPLEYDQLKHLDFLDRCLKETLRLRPPIMTMMRMVKTQQVYLYRYNRISAIRTRPLI